MRPVVLTRLGDNSRARGLPRGRVVLADCAQTACDAPVGRHAAQLSPGGIEDALEVAGEHLAGDRRSDESGEAHPFAGFLEQARTHIDTDAAGVDLACAQTDESDRAHQTKTDPERLGQLDLAVLDE